MAVHSLEHLGRPALNGKVQLRHHRIGLGHGGDGLVGEVLGMRAREADALDARLPHGAEQLGESRRAVALATERINVLA